MPQAPDRLRTKFADDGTALRVIAVNFVDKKGVISPKVKGYKPTKREQDAIDYLWLEWDYAYDPKVSN